MTKPPHKAKVIEVVERALRSWCASATARQQRAVFVSGALCGAGIYTDADDSKRIIEETARALLRNEKIAHEANAHAIIDALIDRRLITVT